MTDQIIPGDIIPGDADDNVLLGGAGPDTLNGEGGNDTLAGGLGDDELNGGEGIDTAVYNDIDVPVEVTLNGAGVGTAVREAGFAVSVQDVAVNSLTPGAPAATDFIGEALAGNLYFNIHTNDFNAGEIRGQIDQLVSDTTTDGVRTITLTASLDAAQEPGPTSDSLATGEATVTIAQAVDGSITYSTDLSVSGLATSDLLPVAGVSSIHIHNAPRGVNGPVVQDVVQDAGGDISGNALIEAADTGDGDVFDEYVETDTLDSIENIIGSDDGDTVILSGGVGNTVDGGAGDDFIAGGGGVDFLDGGAGVDTNSFSTIGVGVVADLGSGSASYQTGNGTTIFENFSGFENLDGSAQNDQLFGDGGDNVLTGNDGNDLLSGRGSADTVDGGDGDDILQGGGGNDVLDGGGGIDTADFRDINVNAESPEGTGVTADLSAGQAGYTAPSGAAITDQITNVENLTGSQNNDDMTGDDGANLIAGGAGDDIINGGAGDDILRGDALGPGEAITVTVENLVGEGGTFLTPLWFGFHDGADFDLFTAGEAASFGLERLAEDGSVEGIAAEFNQQVGENGVDATIISGAGAPGPIDPGESASFTLNVDPNAVGEGFFTWATMVIPSNDAFLAALANALTDAIFDTDGNFLGPLVIERSGSDVLDAGTEVNNELDAAFLNQTARNTGTDENGVVGDHPGFNGSVGNPDGTPVNVLGGTTAAGTIVDPTVGDFTADDDPILRITIDRAAGGNDVLDGGLGDDIIDGGLGADTLIGGLGDDTLITDGLDDLDGGEGVDTADFSGFAENAIANTPGAFNGVIVDLDVNSAGAAGTPGQDGAVLNAPPGAVAVGGVVPAANQIQSITDVENLVGTDFNDGLFGNNEVNVISAGGGNDVVHGFGGGDFLAGGDGLDTILFSAAPVGVTVDLNSQVSAEAFEAIAAGGSGPTASSGGAGADVLSGFENVTGSANGDDVIIGDSADNTLNGQGGDDNLIGGGGNDNLIGGEGEDILTGGAGDDRAVGGSDDDVLLGRSGADTLVGGNGSDKLTGNRGEDLLRGGQGEDILNGGGGADLLRGGGGSDVLNGGAGQDVLTGNRGDDVLSGGQGRDTFVFNGGSGSDLVTDFAGNDLIEITGGASEFADLDISQTDVGTLVSFGQADVLLLNFDADNLNAGDFVFS
jgi:Ca2+-binding RTX toxin-like protein